MKKLYSILLLALSFQITNAQRYGDFTFYSALNSSNAYLLDSTGSVYHTWTFSSNAKTGYNSYIFPGGYIIRSILNSGNSFIGEGVTGALQLTDWNSNPLWDYVYSSATYCMHDDICLLPSGNVLLISYDLKSASQVTQAGCSQNITMWLDKIVEIEQIGPNIGAEVWVWRAWDHIVQDFDSTKNNYSSSIADHPECLNINYQTSQDWLHINSIDYNPDLDQIIIGSSKLNEFYVIDHSTTTAQAAGSTGGFSNRGGEILYRWGNPAAYGAAGSANFNGIHDAHFIPNNCPLSGFIAGFNNNGISTSQSCIDFINPPRNGYDYNVTPGMVILPYSFTFRFPCNGYSNNLGSSQELPNGNTLMCISEIGFIYEIDSAQHVIWTKNVNDTVPNAMRIDACYINGYAPDAPLITQSGDTLFSTIGVNYIWYLNGVEDTTVNSMIYLPSQSGDYTVIVTDSNGCRSDQSAVFTYSTNRIFKFDKNEVSVFPNPTNGILSISGIENNSSDLIILISDEQGRKIAERKFSSKLDLTNLKKGGYFISIVDKKSIIYKNRIVLN